MCSAPCAPVVLAWQGCSGRTPRGQALSEEGQAPARAAQNQGAGGHRAAAAPCMPDWDAGRRGRRGCPSWWTAAPSPLWRGTRRSSRQVCAPSSLLRPAMPSCHLLFSVCHLALPERVPACAKGRDASTPRAGQAIPVAGRGAPKDSHVARRFDARAGVRQVRADAQHGGAGQAGQRRGRAAAWAHRLALAGARAGGQTAGRARGKAGASSDRGFALSVCAGHRSNGTTGDSGASGAATLHGLFCARFSRAGARAGCGQGVARAPAGERHHAHAHVAAQPAVKLLCFLSSRRSGRATRRRRARGRPSPLVPLSLGWVRSSVAPGRKARGRQQGACLPHVPAPPRPQATQGNRCQGCQGVDGSRVVLPTTNHAPASRAAAAHLPAGVQGPGWLVGYAAYRQLMRPDSHAARPACRCPRAPSTASLTGAPWSSAHAPARASAAAASATCWRVRGMRGHGRPAPCSAVLCWLPPLAAPGRDEARTWRLREFGAHARLELTALPEALCGGRPQARWARSCRGSSTAGTALLQHKARTAAQQQAPPAAPRTPPW